MERQATEIPEAFRQAMDRPKQPPGEPTANEDGDAVWHVAITFTPAKKAVVVSYPPEWGFGDWISLLLFMNSTYGEQMVEMARRMEVEAKARAGNG